MLTHQCRYTVPYRLLPWSRMDVDKVPLGRTEAKMAFKVCCKCCLNYFDIVIYVSLSIIVS